MKDGRAAGARAADGYSGTPLARKLGIIEHARVAFVRPPDGFADSLALPPGVRVLGQARAPLDVVVLFVTRRSELARRFPGLAGALRAGGGLWVAWPKRASKVCTDLTEQVARDVGLAAGLVDNKVCAIDETWSGLRFVHRAGRGLRR
ncbi:MAG: DUF3052 domain-containing protein [Acidimicrobiia bacterium]|nr:DUF3052 domain-containing protein [Acidimicrobiia bacterium]